MNISAQQPCPAVRPQNLFYQVLQFQTALLTQLVIGDFQVKTTEPEMLSLTPH